MKVDSSLVHLQFQYALPGSFGSRAHETLPSSGVISEERAYQTGLVPMGGWDGEYADRYKSDFLNRQMAKENGGYY